MTDQEKQAQAEEPEEAVAQMEGTPEEQIPAELQALQQALEASQTKAAEYLDGWQRARAEFANYKKRIERDQAQTYQNAVGSVVKRYLAVVDDLERALQTRPQEGEGAAWSAGIELIYRKMLAALDADGVKVMQAEGQMFDPLLHEAVMQEASPAHQSGQVIEVLQKGYVVGDRVLRPAMVRVAE